MSEFFLLSFVFVLAACLPLWADARRRPEYGSRPRMLAAALGLFALIGALSGATLLVAWGNEALACPLVFTVEILYAPLLFLLEYSVHMQRIKKNLLGKEFKRKVGFFLLAFALSVAACAGLWAVVLGSGGEIDGLAIGMMLLVSGCSIAAYLVANASFDLQLGIIRRTSYTFIIGACEAVAFFVCFVVSGGGYALALASLSILNIAFALRFFHEYFVYRMGHINDMHAQQLEFEHTKTELLNKVLFSTHEEDLELIGDTLRASLEELKSSFDNTDLVFGSMMVFRRSGRLLVVDDAKFILEHCVPLADIGAIKQMKAEVLRGNIMTQAFDLERIAAASDAELGFAELAIKRMIETKSQAVVENLPQSLSRLFKLIVIRPVLNQDELQGMVVLFKAGIDYVFPQEEAILQALSGNLSLIFTLIDGKKAQDEKNRLGREMDIAKNIQTSILPKRFEMEGYEAEATMVTASEVGGDLYDLARTKFGGYLDIADVSGHGLPAGIAALIHMSALHSAVRTAESLGSQLEVSALYDIVNNVLVEINRDRIGSDKFMTCNILAEKGGRIDYAGSHLVGLVYRSGSGEVEEFEGMQGKAAFMGISEYASSAGSRGSFDMASGDLLLLYTDGLIEARDMHDRLFGLDNLKRILKENGRKSLEEAKQAMLDALSEFAETGDRAKYSGSFADDVSLVLVRRK
jgi:Serine phosphatase RsbU, regulator of sigma subunit